MPRHTRPLPHRVGRFRYWQYEFSCPSGDAPPAPATADQIAHRQIVQTIRQIWHDPEVAPRHRADFEPVLTRLGIKKPTPAIFALAYYLATDRLWSQDPEAWGLLKQLPRSTRDVLLVWERGIWRRRTPCTWDALLPAIVGDQALFEEILDRGPVQTGLVDIRAPRKRPTRPLLPEWAAMAPCQRRDQHEIILHWFAHALRNLVRYRDGHAPLPWHPTACARQCTAASRHLQP